MGELKRGVRWYLAHLIAVHPCGTYTFAICRKRPRKYEYLAYRKELVGFMDFVRPNIALIKRDKELHHDVMAVFDDWNNYIIEGVMIKIDVPRSWR